MTNASPAGEPGAPITCDTRDMHLIHAVFRRAFGDAVAIVDRVPAGDASRAQVVADHLVEMTEALHHHHQGEDRLLWDRLATRAPACALHVDRMRSQHAEIGTRLAALEAALSSWRTSASAADAAQVRATLERMNEALVEHLGDEEASILPVAGTSLRQAEWDQLGEAGRASIPRDRLFVQLGFVLDVVPEAERAQWKREFLPLPARVLYALVGKRQYEKHRRLVYGDLA